MLEIVGYSMPDDNTEIRTCCVRESRAATVRTRS